MQTFFKEVIMLKVYAANWCPHCTQTIEYLKNNKIEFEYFEIEEQSKDIVQKIIEVNGGDDWVVPTLEFNGKWRQGKIYNEIELGSDLHKLGVK
jgi:mycoredoxin